MRPGRFGAPGALAAAAVSAASAAALLGAVALLVRTARADGATTSSRAAGDVSETAAPPVPLEIDCAAPAHPISPLVYGIGFDPMREATDGDWIWKELNPSARRWGGNASSRYNWQLGNAWNTAADWFFRNVDYTEDGGGSRAVGPIWRRFLRADAAHAAGSALTLPMIGWVAKDTRSVAFPASRRGRQQHQDPDLPEAGNGRGTDGAPLPPGPPEATSVRSTPESIARWVRAIGDDAQLRRAVSLYVLDNEPTLWHETHRDVHPEPVGYDELLERTVAYASAVRAADPSARIAGPALWGWTAYFYSGRDAVAGFWRHPDRRAHGDEPLLPWYLRQLRARRERTGGPRLVDVVDVHFYPQGEGIGFREEGSTTPEASARRIRATRALWDPGYVDESWIGEPVQLIPRLKAWVAQTDPGLGLAVGEYNFGAERHPSGGLALAEALGRFGEQGLEAAFYWTYPPRGSAAYWAFRAYRNFDGRGGRFLDLGLATRAPAGLSLFASRSPGGDHLVAVALNLDPARAANARVALVGCAPLADAQARVYRGGPAGFEPSAVQAEGSGLALTLPPYSITVLDLRARADGGTRR